MILKNYFKNTVKNKNIKAILFFIASYAVNMAIFWLFYEKLLKRPHAILYGTVAYVGGFLILLTPILNSINKILVEKPYIKNNKQYPLTLNAFEKVKSGYVASGNKNAKGMKLCIYDEKYIKNTTDVIPYGDSELSVNALAEMLPEETNIGRFAYSMDLVEFGYGMNRVLVMAFNPFYTAISFLLSLILTVSSGFYGAVGFGWLQRLVLFENKMINKVLSQWFVLGNKLCELKVNDSFFRIMNNNPFCEEKVNYINSIR